MHRITCHTRRRFWIMPLLAMSAAGCQIELPVAASRYAGCWRFQVRLVSADGARANIDRDFIIELDNTGALSRVVMRREGEGVGNPLDPGATFVDLISSQAAATLQASLFPGRLNPDPTKPDVVFSSTVDATTLGFNVAASLTVVPSEDVRYAVNLRVRVDGTSITDVRGTVIDQAGPDGVLSVARFLNDPGQLNAQVSCPLVVSQVCSRFHDSTVVGTSTRFVAYDSVAGLAGQTIVSSNSSLQMVDLATGGRTATLLLNQPVQGRMAVDEARRRLYASTKNDVNNNALAVVDLVERRVLRTVELLKSGCVDRGTRGAAGVIPSSGQVIVTISSPDDTRFNGVIRVDPVGGQILGALQNVHLTSDVFFEPLDLVVLESRNLVLVANSGGPVLTPVPLDAISRELRGGDSAACQNDVGGVTLPAVITAGTSVLAVAADAPNNRGLLLLGGPIGNDGIYQWFTVSGSGAGANVTLGSPQEFGRPARLYGLSIDPNRDEAYIVNGNQNTLIVNLNNGNVSAIGSVATADITAVTPVLGRNRLLQAGINTVVGEYCLP